MHIGKDAFTMWAISGMIGVITRDVYSYFAKVVGLSKFYIWAVGANIFLDKKEVSTVGGTALGFLNDLVIGAMLGVLIGVLLEWTGRTNYLVKGMGVGLMAWVFFFGVLFHNLPAMDLAPRDPLSSISAFIGHAIFGIVAAWACVKLTPTGVFGNSGQTKTERKKVVANLANEFVGTE